jgi:predicted Zn-dependent protease
MQRLLFGAVALAVAAGFVPGDASACENEVERRVNPNVARLLVAERQLRQGQDGAAFRSAAGVLRRLRAARAGTELRIRAERIAAVATVRLDGAVDLERAAPARSIEDARRQENLWWARGVLGRLARRSDDPELRALYAQALARFDSQRDEARQILEELARRDLMPDAWGYRTLAELRARAGESQARDEALARCTAMAGPLGRRICSPPPVAS